MERRFVTKTSASLTDISDNPSEIPRMSWCTKHEEILRKWKARCFVSLWLCIASAYFFGIVHNWLSYPVIIMSAISSATLFSYDAHVVKYCLGVITLSCGIITCIIRHIRPGEMYQNHSCFAKRYLNLIRTIDTCLSLTASMRPAPDMFIERVGNEIDILESTQLDPPMLIIRRFEKKYGPVHRILYGDDIVELMKIELQANTLFNKLKSSSQRLSDVSSSEFPVRTTKLKTETAYRNMDQTNSGGTSRNSDNAQDLE